MKCSEALKMVAGALGSTIDVPRLEAEPWSPLALDWHLQIVSTSQNLNDDDACLYNHLRMHQHGDFTLQYAVRALPCYNRIVCIS
jgi:hypothetical protein